MNDWAIELIDQINRLGLYQDDAVRLFAECFAIGGTPEACERYRACAVAEVNFDPNGYSVLVFADGSLYCGFQEGIDRFFPDIESFREQFPAEAASVAVILRGRSYDVVQS